MELEINKHQQDAALMEFDKTWAEIHNKLRVLELAKDKASGLTNEEARNTAFQNFCLRDDNLQDIYAKIRDNKWSQAKLKIEVESQMRAFQLKVLGCDYK